jgi:transcriptional regulator with XRE-family HTH domain
VQLRQLRKQIKVPLWVPAAAAKMDSTLLSKIETGKRLPTPEQLAALTRYFKVPVEPLETRRLAEEMLKSYGAHPGFGAASAIVREEAGEYPVKKRSTEVSKRTKPVDKPKKMK